MPRFRPFMARPSAVRPSVARPSAAGLIAIAAASVFAIAQASAGEVYQWTDAQGVTHYSQTPPPGIASKYRVITHRQGEAPATPAAQAAEDPQCGVARANIALLEGGGRVQRDTNGDGVPDRDLSEAERGSQLQLARMVLSANCTAPTQPPAPVSQEEGEYASEGSESESGR